jgi:hypothetical protein
MAEANDSVHQAQVRASMGAAVMTLARRQAINVTKEQLRAQGLKPQHMSRREEARELPLVSPDRTRQM